MRILQINDNYKIIGGAETHFRSLIKQLRLKGLTIYAFSFGKKGIKNRYLYIFGKNILFSLNYYLFYFLNPVVYSKLKNYIREKNPDVIHLHRITVSPLAILLACSGRRIFQTVHDCQFCLNGWGTYRDTLTDCTGRYGIKCVTRKCVPIHKFPFLYIEFRIRDYLLKKLNVTFICPSQMILGKMRDRGFQDCIHIPPFTEFKTSDEYQDKQKCNELLYVGRISIEKGITYLLEAFATLRDKYPDLKLRVIGDGPLLKGYRGKYRNDNRIIFMGKLAPEELREYYENALLTVVPSVWTEQFGLVGIESMACGTPCVASDVGGIPEWCIDNQTGFLVPPKDSKTLAEKISYLLDHFDIRGGIGQKGMNFGKQKFNKETILAKLISIYSNSKMKY